MDRSLVTKACPLALSRGPQEAGAQVLVPVQWEGADLGWTSAESRSPLSPHLPFQSRRDSGVMTTGEGLETESSKCFSPASWLMAWAYHSRGQAWEGKLRPRLS